MNLIQLPSKKGLLFMRFDAALAEWRRCADVEPEQAFNVRCDVCLNHRYRALTRGTKTICEQCGVFGVSVAKNHETRAMLPKADVLYAFWKPA